MYPKLTDAHKQEIIDKLKKIKAAIQGGESSKTKQEFILKIQVQLLMEVLLIMLQKG